MTEPDYTDKPYGESVPDLGALFVVSTGAYNQETGNVGVYVDVADVRLARQFFPLSELEAEVEPGPDGRSRLAEWIGNVISASLTGDGHDQCGDCGAVIVGDSHLTTEHAPDCSWQRLRELDGNPWRPDNLG